MAGFDAHFSFNPNDEALIRALFTAARRRARRLNVRYRSKILPGYAYVAFDGQGFWLDMLLERLGRDLPTIAETVDSIGRSPEQRRRLANGVVEIISRWRMQLYDRYNYGDYLPPLRGLQRQPYRPAVYELFPRQHEDLWTRLSVTLDVLTSWALEEIAPEVALEELHTAFELLLTRAARKRRAPTFAELVKLADESGWLLGRLGLPWLDSPGISATYGPSRRTLSASTTF